MRLHSLSLSAEMRPSATSTAENPACRIEPRLWHQQQVLCQSQRAWSTSTGARWMRAAKGSYKRWSSTGDVSEFFEWMITVFDLPRALFKARVVRPVFLNRVQPIKSPNWECISIESTFLQNIFDDFGCFAHGKWMRSTEKPQLRKEITFQNKSYFALIF